jgi:zinc transporter ZupT
VGLSLAIAIIIHVIPEGMAIAAPIYHSTGRYRSIGTTRTRTHAQARM